MLNVIQHPVLSIAVWNSGDGGAQEWTLNHVQGDLSRHRPGS